MTIIGLLDVTTSSRSTWLWASSVAEAMTVRAALDDRSLRWEPAYQGDQELVATTDVDIGVTAAEVCMALNEVGWTFRWHRDQHPMNRRETLFGLPIAPADDGGHCA